MTVAGTEWLFKPEAIDMAKRLGGIAAKSKRNGTWVVLNQERTKVLARKTTDA